MDFPVSSSLRAQDVALRRRAWARRAWIRSVERFLGGFLIAFRSSRIDFRSCFGFSSNDIEMREVEGGVAPEGRDARNGSRGHQALPKTGMDAPWITLASSLARNTITLAMS